MTNKPRKFKALISVKDTGQPGERVSVLASDLIEAKRLLDEKYDSGNVFDLHNEEDGARAR